MGKSEQFDLQFAYAMKDHPYGVAMYRPPRSTVLRLGSVGYFDDFGAWNIIVDLTNAKDLASKGLGPMNVAEIEAAPVDNSIKWGPILSTNTKSSKVSLSGGIAPAPGIPVNASAVYSYDTSGDTGAILITSPPVRHERLYHTSPFKQWMKENALKILKKYPDEVKAHGLWIVTSTHTTDKCSILMWREKGKKLHIGFSADVAGAGSIKPDLEWYGANTDEGWGEYTAEGKDRPVVFFGGLRFTASRWYNPKKGLNMEDSPGFKPARASYNPASTGVTHNPTSSGVVYKPRHLGVVYNPMGTPKERITTVTDPDDEDHDFRFEVEERLQN